MSALPRAEPESGWDRRWCRQCGDTKSGHGGRDHEWRALPDEQIREMDDSLRKTATEMESKRGVGLATFLGKAIKPPSWLVDELVPDGPAVGAIIGAYKNGKSLAGLQLCMAVAAGSNSLFMGHSIDTGGPTVFIEYEGSEGALQKRAAGMAAKYGLLMSNDVHIVHRPPVKIDTDDGEKWLRGLCEGRALCVVGPVSKCCTFKDENAPGEWQAVAERLQRITDATGCTILLVHHTRKPSIDHASGRKVDDFFNGARGSNAYMGAIDTALGFEKPPDSIEGILYSLQRDGESGRAPYDFEVASLTIWPSNRTVGRVTKADRAEALFVWIADHPDRTRDDMMAALEFSEDTIKDWLKMLGDRVVESGAGSEKRRYRTSSISV